MTSAFTFHALRFHYTSPTPGDANVDANGDANVDANLVRGAFGSALKNISDAAYQRYFAPKAFHGPSGLADSPRPFVFRLREPGIMGLNVFAAEGIDVFSQAVRAIKRIEITTIVQPQRISLPLVSSTGAIENVRVHFLTPTELKPTREPHFGVLMARIRDRIHTLSQLWGDGGLTPDFTALDFKEFGARASQIQMTRCKLAQVHQHRISHATGQRHSIGGFTGVAEYRVTENQGDVAEFLPYLEIARHTGVGRQTVWGKGEIAYETF